MFLSGEKINSLSWKQLKSGVMFVTSKTAFTMKYLLLAYLRLLRARTAPGQEAAVLQIFHDKEQALPFSLPAEGSPFGTIYFMP